MKMRVGILQDALGRGEGGRRKTNSVFFIITFKLFAVQSPNFLTFPNEALLSQWNLESQLYDCLKTA